jgi:hypothetical protein
MTAMTSQHQHLCGSPVSPQLVVITRRKCPPTTRVEHVLLFLTILLLPLEQHLPGIGRFSFLFILFAVSSIYVVIRRFGSIVYVWNHRIFLVSYVLIFIGFVLETYSPSTNYTDIVRIANMFIGAIIIAVLCRDIKALKSFMFACILTGVVASFYLFLSVYGNLQGVKATDFGEASTVRNEAFGDESMQLKQVNSFALSNSVPPAAATALAFALMSRSAFVRSSLFGITVFCFIASFLPFSRGVIVTTLMACMAVVLAYGRANREASFQRLIQIIAVILGLGMCMLLWVPPAVFARLTVPSGTAYEGSSDPRVTLINSALAHLPEYWLVGVGAGNFWGPWGRRNGFLLEGSRGVKGVHNAFVQLAIYWGVPSLLLLISIIYYAYKCLPKKCGNNPFSLAIVGFTVTAFVILCVSHNLYSKSYSLALGILIGTRCWLWPAGGVST